MNEYNDDADANRYANLIWQMLKLKEEHPLPDSRLLPDTFDLGLNRRNACPTPAAFDSFAKDSPEAGMPYALPALSESEQALMIRRVEQGSTYTPRVALGEDFRERIERWEAFLNEDSLEDFLATELQGIDLPASEGTNPCKFGMVGATGAHTSSTTAEEDNFFSKSTSVEPSATRVGHPFVKSALGAFEGDTLLASGYQGIWATENTRAALFDAMDREETYATTGSRMIVRFFGGWEFNDDDLRSRQPAFVGYEIGVASLLCSTKLK